MNNEKHTTEQLSFWQLIQNSRIEIPIIQRDYAQGREDKKKVRMDFLNALSGAIDTPAIELDFIYGSIEGDCFQPLDGQQRLTTLFLLHWYAATRGGHMSKGVRNALLRFTYETRVSSREFCIDIVRKDIIIDEVTEKISGVIKDAAWFSLSWEKDPTIKAMLIMLDDIHSVFKHKVQLWENLTRSSLNPITFQAGQINVLL